MADKFGELAGMFFGAITGVCVGVLATVVDFSFGIYVCGQLLLISAVVVPLGCCLYKNRGRTPKERDDNEFVRFWLGTSAIVAGLTPIGLAGVVLAIKIARFVDDVLRSAASSYAEWALGRLPGFVGTAKGQ
jgi:hypothetical protein